MSYSDIGGKNEKSIEVYGCDSVYCSNAFLKRRNICQKWICFEAKGKEMERIENISKNLHGKQIKVDDMGLAWSSELKIARVNLAYNGKIISHFSPKFSYVYNEDLANWFKDFEGREVTLILYTDEDGTREILRVKYTIVPMVEPKPEETVEPKPSEQFKSSKPDEKIKAIEETVPPCPLGMGDDHSPSMQD